jgi:hypothetical protein
LAAGAGSAGAEPRFTAIYATRPATHNARMMAMAFKKNLHTLKLKETGAQRAREQT